MTTIMLKTTASTTRASTFAGRVRSIVITVAPGMRRIVTTPGNGVSGEWAAPRATEDTRAATNQIPVGATRDPNSLIVDHCFATGPLAADSIACSSVLELLLVTTSVRRLRRRCLFRQGRDTMCRWQRESFGFANFTKVVPIGAPA
jgi:hypothetical protein